MQGITITLNSVHNEKKITWLRGNAFKKPSDSKKLKNNTEAKQR